MKNKPKRLTKKQLEDKIKRSNANFEALSPAEKRVEIAKDVIKQVNAKKFIPTSGEYFNNYSVENKLRELTKEEGQEFELQSLLPKVTCEVCAKGCLFLSDIMKRDNYKVDGNGMGLTVYSGEIENRLKGIFSKNQLDLIETAFEERVVESNNKYLCANSMAYREYFNQKWLTSIAVKAIEFGEKYKEANERILAIMENIVKNKGYFRVR